MECHDARLLLTLQRREPDQLDGAEALALEAHVELCPACRTWAHGEARFESAVAAAVRNVTVPAGLKDRISSRVSANRPRTWGAKTLGAIAAALLLAVGGYSLTRPEPVDVEKRMFVNFEDEGRDPQDVQAYFAELGYEMTPPPNFRYDLLHEFKLATFQGRTVPRLTFVCRTDKGTVKAHVFCLPRSRFGYAGDDTVQTFSGDRKFHVIRGESGLYFVDCLGGDLGILKQGTI